ncbi:MFS transporter [Microvirga sp. 2MCAF38]|uniref:MFS transporter n=1 Tax=Microvirga sp. 2MCAF38 TaxID=3232989 RepID=UPI003F992C7E
MSTLSDLRELTPQQRKVIIASFLGWTLDAFDFFLLVFVLKDIAEEFSTTIQSVTIAILLTLAMRPVGALLFGLAADRWGRRPTLMANILLYSGVEFASGLSPNLTVLIILRAIYGIAMGGEWGVGASLAMESIPPKIRGMVSGILQAGYPAGYLLASLVFFLLYTTIGWRGMFFVGAAPALLVLYIRSQVEESPVFVARQKEAIRPNLWQIMRDNARLAIWAILMMTAFNFFSHGTQDIYPTFLEVQRGLSTHAVGLIAIIFNIGAMLGGLFFGMLSDRIGRRKSIVIAALLAIPMIWPWAYGANAIVLTVGAFMIQFFVQGAWGVVPVHLNELSPDAVRGTFPGVVYQLGNLLASANATMQAGIAAHYNGDYAFALAIVASIVAVAVALLAGFGFEAKGVRFGPAQEVPA